MTIDLIERKTAAQKIIAKTQAPHDSIKIKDADELQCACATGALKKSPFSDVDFSRLQKEELEPVFNRDLVNVGLSLL